MDTHYDTLTLQACLMTQHIQFKWKCLVLPFSLLPL